MEKSSHNRKIRGSIPTVYATADPPHAADGGVWRRWVLASQRNSIFVQIQSMLLYSSTLLLKHCDSSDSERCLSYLTVLLIQSETNLLSCWNSFKSGYVTLHTFYRSFEAPFMLWGLQNFILVLILQIPYFMISRSCRVQLWTGVVTPGAGALEMPILGDSWGLLPPRAANRNCPPFNQVIHCPRAIEFESIWVTILYVIVVENGICTTHNRKEVDFCKLPSSCVNIEFVWSKLFLEGTSFYTSWSSFVETVWNYFETVCSRILLNQMEQLLRLPM